MNLSPTSRTLFLVQIITFLTGVIVITCLCLYVSAYPKSPDAGGLSGISIATLIFALISTLATAVLALRQKAGRTMKAWMEGLWVGFASLMWILASVGGIAKPANDMRNITCKVFSNGTETDDANFKRACQASFAATAFSIMSALLFLATCGLLITFSIQRKVREKKASKVKVGGHYTLAPSPSQYRRAEQAAKEEEEAEQNQEIKGHSRSSTMNQAETSGATAAELEPLEGHRTSSIELPENVYRDPVIVTSSPSVPVPAPVHAAPTTALSPAPLPYHHQQYSSQGSGHYGAGSESGHMQYPSYHSNAGGYGYGNGNNMINNGAFSNYPAPPQQQQQQQHGVGSGHMHQASQMTTVSGYDNTTIGPYHSQYPSATGPAPGAVYPLMAGAPEFYHQQQQPQQDQGVGFNTIITTPPGHQQQPSSNQVPFGTMPRPEHF